MTVFTYLVILFFLDARKVFGFQSEFMLFLPFYG